MAYRLALLHIKFHDFHYTSKIEIEKMTEVSRNFTIEFFFKCGKMKSPYFLTLHYGAKEAKKEGRSKEDSKEEGRKKEEKIIHNL